MRLSYPDYIKLVKESYKSKRGTNELSSSLIHPTLTKIKKECLVVYNKGSEKKDEKALNDFFEFEENGKSLHQLMKAFDTDKFKPLQNYLLGKTEKTDDKNVELLAWLINFKHRPYFYDKNFALSDEEKVLIGQPLDIIDEPINTDEAPPKEPEEINTVLKVKGDSEPIEKKVGGPVPSNAIPKNTIWNNRSKIASITALLIFAGGIYTWQKKPDMLKMESANTVCVFWEEDHYQEIACNGNSYGQPIISMDAEKAKRFRKITRPDTITQWSVGKLFYIKKDKTIECYTEGGRYPKDLSRNLRVISQLIFDKYLLKKDSAIRNSLKDTNTTFTNDR